MLQPCPRGRVKWDDGQVITIGQLAKYVGVSIKTIRVYHDKGLLPEPDRDASGYRRYGANDAIDLIKIRTLAESGVPLARIRDLRSASDEEFQEALHEIDDDLTATGAQSVITGFGRSPDAPWSTRHRGCGPGMSEAASSLRHHGHSDRCSGGLPDQRRDGEGARVGRGGRRARHCHVHVGGA
ncbi:MerR family transcriptional regulator [Streptomyces sp. A30]|uniref:MerR family transcriptional regulator n=1 Tax=Streptomyces sp. A30 TaxID=2789273 RepID=UPI00397F36A3